MEVSSLFLETGSLNFLIILFSAISKKLVKPFKPALELYGVIDRLTGKSHYIEPPLSGSKNHYIHSSPESPGNSDT